MSDTHEQHAKVLEDLASDHRFDADEAAKDGDEVVSNGYRLRQRACEAGAQALRQQGRLLAIAGLVNGYHNGLPQPSAAETLRSIADALGKPMEAD